MPGRATNRSSVSYRFVGPPAFLAGVAAAYVATIGGPTTADVSGLMGWENGLALVAWAAIGFIASLGAARVASQWSSDSVLEPPSLVGCGIPSGLGSLSVFLLPSQGLRLLGGAGALLMLYLALGLLAGLVDLATRIFHRSSAR